MGVRRSWLAGLAALCLVAPGVAQAATSPDLQVTRVAPTLSGRALVVDATVANKGRKAAAKSKAAVLLSRDATRSKDDQRLTRSDVARLAPGATKRIRSNVTLPASAGTGARFVIVCADDGSAVRERSERNNCKASRQVTLPAFGTPIGPVTPGPAETTAPGPVDTTPSSNPGAPNTDPGTTTNNSPPDSDHDGIPDSADNCPGAANSDQADTDADGAGNVCDPCPNNASTTTCTIVDPNDQDGDSVSNAVDNCPEQANSDQADDDGDGKGNVCDPCPSAANPGNSSCPVSVYDINSGAYPVGKTAQVGGLVVTAKNSSTFWMQLPSTAPGYAGAAGSAIKVYLGAGSPQFPSVGDVVNVDGTVTMFNNQLELANVTNVIATAMNNALPDPTAVTTTASLANLDAVLVRVDDLTLASKATSTWDLTSGLEHFTIAKTIIGTLPSDDLGQHYTSITGIADNQQVLPRSADDFVAG